MQNSVGKQDTHHPAIPTPTAPCTPGLPLGLPPGVGLPPGPPPGVGLQPGPSPQLHQKSIQRRQEGEHPGLHGQVGRNYLLLLMFFREADSDMTVKFGSISVFVKILNEICMTDYTESYVLVQKLSLANCPERVKERC